MQDMETTLADLREKQQRREELRQELRERFASLASHIREQPTPQAVQHTPNKANPYQRLGGLLVGSAMVTAVVALWAVTVSIIRWVLG